MSEIIKPSDLIHDGSFENHFKHDVIDDVYHADKSFVSSSSLKLMLTKSPKTFYSRHFLGKGKEPTPAMKLGKLAHMAILEGKKFKEKYVVMPKFTGFTKDGRETDSPHSTEVKQKKAEWISKLPTDAVICTEEERDALVGMIESILSNQRAREFFIEGIPECSGYYVDPETKIRCRIRPDFFSPNRMILADLKTTRDCREESFKWDIFGDKFDPLWYDFSLAMYSEGFYQITGKRLNLSAWIAIEKVPPYECAVHPMTIPVQEVGQIKYRQALRLLRKSIDENNWPGVQENGDTSLIVPPDYILEKYGVNYEGDLI